MDGASRSWGSSTQYNCWCFMCCWNFPCLSSCFARGCLRGVFCFFTITLVWTCKQRASSRAAGSHGLLEIRCSDDILITPVVGPGEEAHIDSHEIFQNETPHTNAKCWRKTELCTLHGDQRKGDIKIAKRTLLRDKNYSDAIDMRATIDERVKDIAFKLDSQVKKKKN